MKNFTRFLTLYLSIIALIFAALFCIFEKKFQMSFLKIWRLGKSVKLRLVLLVLDFLSSKLLDETERLFLSRHNYKVKSYESKIRQGKLRKQVPGGRISRNQAL